MGVPRAEAGTPLYVHLPLCVVKCTYCDFFSVADAGQDRGRIVDGLLREAEERAPSRPRTVFLGGGTPSHFSEQELRRLLDGLDELTGFRASAIEVTVECNPESLDRPKAELLVSLGATRLSIGLQSLRAEALALFGRPHTPEQGIAAVVGAREAGVSSLGVDLIFAHPGHTLEQWDVDLREVLSLAPDHLSAYSLAFEQGTVLSRWLEEGRLAPLDEDVELALFRHTREVAAEHGLDAYEISNFARPSAECHHNLGYWRNEPYVGLGPSAVSRVGAARRGNARSIGTWLDDLETGRVAWEEAPRPLVRLGETWWLGLRLAEGVDPERARRTAGFHGDHDPAEERAKWLAEAGLLEHTGSAYRLTDRALPLADAVARELLQPAEPEPTARPA